MKNIVTVFVVIALTAACGQRKHDTLNASVDSGFLSQLKSAGNGFDVVNSMAVSQGLDDKITYVEVDAKNLDLAVNNITSIFALKKATISSEAELLRYAARVEKHEFYKFEDPLRCSVWLGGNVSEIIVLIVDPDSKKIILYKSTI